MANLKNVIYLSNEDYATLLLTGTVTIDGTTLTYDADNVYVTPEAVATSSQDGLMSSTDKTNLDNHIANTSNPHSVTKSQVGLGSVVNTGDSATPIQEGTTKFTTGGAYTELSKKVDTTRKVNNKALSSDITLLASDVGALPSSTKYGYSLGVSGTTVSLKDQDGNVLNSITTQDTTYTSKTASSGGTDVSLVTTGEKYTWNSKMSNPMTTSGDIIYGGSSGTPTRLAKGSNDTELTINSSGNFAWQARPHLYRHSIRIRYGSPSTGAGQMDIYLESGIEFSSVSDFITYFTTEKTEKIICSATGACYRSTGTYILLNMERKFTQGAWRLFFSGVKVADGAELTGTIEIASSGAGLSSFLDTVTQIY